MGRSKVPQDARRRVQQACKPCKASKRRCNGQQPCSRCSKQTRQHQCNYDDDGHAHLESPMRDAAVTRSSRRRQQAAANPEVNSQPVTPANNTDFPTRYSALFSPGSVEQNGGRNAAMVQSPVSLASNTRMMRGMQGEKLYVGPSASLSFLQALRNTFVRRAGTLYTERDGETEALLDAELANQDDADVSDLCEPARLLEYAGCFLSTTSGILNVFPKNELLDRIHHFIQTGQLEPYPCPAAVYLAVAIGAQARSQTAVDSSYARLYFKASRRAMPDVLLAPSVSSVTVSLLTAFYMLTASRKNAAYMYLGVAARAAYALGLHHPSSYSAADSTGAALRLRLWKSICVLDLMICSILGRPPAVEFAGLHDQPVESAADTSLDMCSIAFDASFRAAKIIYEILTRMYSSAVLDPREARQFLNRLTEWREALHVDLRGTVSLGNQLSQDQRDVNSASINVACFYYYTVMLVSRPFLISSLECAEKNGTDAAALGSDQPEKLLPSVGVEAAIYMSETIHSAVSAYAIFPNACFVKTWAFSAALVLAFSMVIEPQASFKTQRAFDLVKESFRLQSNVSPYATQYHHILEDIAAIIRQSHEQIAHQQRQAHQGYVERLFAFDVAGTEGEEHQSTVCESPLSRNADLSHFIENPEMFLFGWDEPAMGQLDNIFDCDGSSFLPESGLTD